MAVTREMQNEAAQQLERSGGPSQVTSANSPNGPKGVKANGQRQATPAGSQRGTAADLLALFGGQAGANVNVHTGGASE